MDKKSDLKVFSSDIERGQKQMNNNLYDLLQLEPATPIKVETRNKGEFCNFTPASGKYYIPKKRNKGSKVKTVRDIRNEFEKDVNYYLPDELTRQETVLFKRIRKGSSRDDDTIKLAKNMLKCGHPISRSTWQMLTNLNPNKNLHSMQYVLWNGRRIRVNGSRGGERNFICHYDLGKKKIIVNNCSSKRKNLTKKRNLMKASLALNLKPGPLSRKKKFDNSYQRNNIGELEPVKLPQIGLEIEPTVGVTIEPTISNILHSLRDVNGTLTKTWAIFAVSTLSNLNKSEVMLMNNETVTFNLNYHNNQNKVLMRRNDAKTTVEVVTDAVPSHVQDFIEADLDNVVKLLVEDVVTSVEISLNQDEMYTGIDVPRDTTPDEADIVNNTNVSKEKLKRKYNELERLDVTVIRLSDSVDINKDALSCNKAFCAFGCVCPSLECRYNIKIHCGRVDCMFECKCDFSRYKALSDLDGYSSDLIPGLYHLDDKINSKLAKEEKKFHQTVVVTEEKSILLKSQRRSLKAPKRYAEFFNNEAKGEDNVRKFLSISALRLDCENIEPLCMVHKLYQCFCQGKFTECLRPEPAIQIENDCKDPDIDSFTDIISDTKYSKSEVKTTGKQYTSKHYRSDRHSSSSDGVYDETTNSYGTGACCRTNPYPGRGHSDKYYYEMNAKIKEMEKNDTRLHNKMMSYISKYCEQTSTESSDCTNTDEGLKNLNQPSDSSSSENSKHFPNKAKLVSWLEANYKHYKRRLEQSNNKNIPMEAPKLGKIALYPWEVILERYKLRKNYFVVTKETPFRIFMAVDLNKPFFANCLSVDKIPIENLRRYPITVRNLLQDVSDMKDNFYIMCGLSDCWELIGSVTKLNGNSDAEQSDIEHSDSVNKSVQGDGNVKIPETKGMENNQDISNKESKWFAMIVNDDFTEIQFHSRGFFVKHDSVMKAINVARVSGKTVRLSSQKFAVVNEGPQFGIYAIPQITDYCVYVGPYEIDEELGMETVKTFHQSSLKSRGVWFITKKTDDINVIDNPLEYMPTIDADANVVIVSEIHEPKINLKPESVEVQVVNKKKEKNTTKVKCEEKENDVEQKSEVNVPLASQTTLPKPEKSVKVVKPIKISKNNGFYQLCPSGRIQQVSLLKSPIKSPEAVETPATFVNFVSSTSSLFTSEAMTIPVIKDTFSLSETYNRSTKSLIKPNISKRPVAEIAPQKKVVPLSTTSQGTTKLGGMLILRPEEINERLSQTTVYSHQTELSNKTESVVKEEINTQMDMDIENFLATSEICAAPSIADVYVIEDDDDTDQEKTESNLPKNVFIECQNIENLGWLKGKRNRENEISFEFPGFKFTDFYPEDEAFVKINQVLSRKVYVPKQIIVEWRVVEAEENLINKNTLKADDFGHDFVLTRHGLRHKRDLLPSATKEAVNSGLGDSLNVVTTSSNTSQNTKEAEEETQKVIDDLHQENRTSEREKRSLQTLPASSVRRNELLTLLLDSPTNKRLKVNEELKDLNE